MGGGNLEDDWRPLVFPMGDRKSQNSVGVVGGGDGGGGEGGVGVGDGWWWCVVVVVAVAPHNFVTFTGTFRYH